LGGLFTFLQFEIRIMKKVISPIILKRQYFIYLAYKIITIFTFNATVVKHLVREDKNSNFG
ncbi:MAG: hypothetical protein OEW70_02945, partial [candidate division WOR-3 bacterium]|nr:hypothetical protein [candidate division WOR-3 bacterium]